MIREVPGLAQSAWTHHQIIRPVTRLATHIAMMSRGTGTRTAVAEATEVAAIAADQVIDEQPLHRSARSRLQRARNNLLHDLVRPAINALHPRIGIHLRYRIFQHIAVAAE